MKRYGYMPDPNYKITGTFYTMIDLSEMIGADFPALAAVAIGKKEKIETDEDIAYALLFRDKIMLAPLSYYSSASQLGYLRITCSCNIFYSTSP